MTGLLVAGAVTAVPASAASSSGQAADRSVDRTAGAATSVRVPTPPPITWKRCADEGLRSLNARCGFLTVPLDYSHPKGAKIQLAVSRVPHTVAKRKYQGVMLVNPGGPGASGVTLATLGQYVPNHAGDAYDWIGFDPRGVGASKPALTCDPNFFHPDRPSYVPRTKALVNTWLAASKKYATACGTQSSAQSALLQHITTIDSAKDMESIRLALGAKQINYYGFSYGTYLGQVYSTLYPSHVRRMVLDSNVDPRKVWYAANLGQDVAFDRNINIWFGWLAKHDSAYHLGKTEQAVSKLWYAQLAGLDKKPAGGIIGPDEWTDAFLAAGYYQSTWTDLANVFSRWVHHHDLAPLKYAYLAQDTPGDDNGYAAYDAVQCSDVRWPQSWSRWARDNWAIYRQAPFETWANVWYNAPCLYWPAPAGTPVQVDGSKVAPVLLIDETLDAATPYEGSLEVRRLFPRASLLALPGGTSHANSLYGNLCEDNTIARYLATGALPKRKPGRSTADATCKPLPRPVPGMFGTAQSPSVASPQSPPQSPSVAPSRAPSLAPSMLPAKRPRLLLHP
jgi:pimeloyl-ACP methyl ester carboxylesterase